MPNLIEWEKRLKPFFDSRLRIIGEIPLSETEVDELGEEVRQFLGGYDKFTQATNILTKRFPYVFLTLLAHFSMYNDQSGYWHALQRVVGADQDLHITRWHQKFVDLARQNDLKTFTESDTPNYYVASIRFHGGIPSYYLPDFFDRMVFPAVTQPDLRKIPPEEALKYLLQRAYLGRPVLDFLENSGDMGLAWFEACCKLVRHARENHGEVLPISAVPELPYNIHSFFEQYNEEKEERGFHWSRPFLEVNLLSENSPIVLRIPEQIVTTQAASQHLQWNISWPGLVKPVVIPCQLARRGSAHVVLGELFPVTGPTTQMTISISSGSQSGEEDTELRRWTLPLLPQPGETPLIAFRNNLHQVPGSRSLPAQPLYLLTPKLAAMVVDPETIEKLESFPALSSGWKEWKLEQWDLTNAISLLLYRDGNLLGNIMPVAREVDQPELVGGHLFDYQENHDQPIYTSAIPSVSIPVASNVTHYQALSGWKARITSVGEAAPTIDRQVTFQAYQDECQFEGSRALLPLERILGSKPAGTYELKVSGPYGIKAEYRLRLWPKLLLQNYSKDLPKAEESREPVHFNVYLQEGAWLEPQLGADPVEILGDVSGFAITALPETRRIELDLVTVNRTGDQIRVPVSIPVVRLRWGLVEENSPTLLIFGQKVLHLSKKRFSQYASSALHVEMHGLGEMVGQLSCQLVETDNETNLLQLADFRKTGFSNDWLKASIEGFIDTIEAINTQVQFQLVYRQNWQSPLIRYVLLEVSPELDVRDAALHQVAECNWKVTWQEDLPLKHRRIMLKSAWQPWAPVIEQKIPDENIGEFTFTEISLPPSKYEVHFYIRRSWEKPQTVPPADGTCLVVDLCTPEERLLDLNIQNQDHDLVFRNCIEEACIHDTLGESKARDEAISRAAVHLIHLSDVRTLVGSVQWMRTKDITPTYLSFFLKQMFNKKLLDIILDKYPQRDESFLEYIRMVGEVRTRSGEPPIYADSARLLLEKVADPLVISTCIRTLLNREDEELPQLVMALIKRGSLSIDDATKLIMNTTEHRLWAMERICGLKQSTFSDGLLATMLQEYFDEDVQVVPDWMQDALVRVINLSQSTMLVSNYLEILINGKHEQAWSVLIKQKKTERIVDEEFYKLLCLDPKSAIGILKILSIKEDFSEWIHKLEEEFPEAAGVLKPGMNVITPFGQARIVSINLTDGTKVLKVLKSDENFILNTVSGEGLERVEVSLDFHELVMNFKKSNSIYRCSICDEFCHPLLTKVNQHQNQTHRSESKSFKILKNPVPFILDEIKYL